MGGRELATRVGGGRGRTVRERDALDQSIMIPMYEEGDSTHL